MEVDRLGERVAARAEGAGEHEVAPASAGRSTACSPPGPGARARRPGPRRGRPRAPAAPPAPRRAAGCRAGWSRRRSTARARGAATGKPPWPARRPAAGRRRGRPSPCGAAGSRRARELVQPRQERLAAARPAARARAPARGTAGANLVARPRGATASPSRRRRRSATSADRERERGGGRGRGRAPCAGCPAGGPGPRASLAPPGRGAGRLSQLSPRGTSGAHRVSRSSLASLGVTGHGRAQLAATPPGRRRDVAARRRASPPSRSLTRRRPPRRAARRRRCPRARGGTRRSRRRRPAAVWARSSAAAPQRRMARALQEDLAESRQVEVERGVRAEGIAGGEERAVEARAARDGEGLAVAKGPAPAQRRVGVAAQRLDDGAGHRCARPPAGHRGAEDGQPLEEVVGAVERVDHPFELAARDAAAPAPPRPGMRREDGGGE